MSIKKLIATAVIQIIIVSIFSIALILTSINRTIAIVIGVIALATIVFEISFLLNTISRFKKSMKDRPQIEKDIFNKSDQTLHKHSEDE